MKGVKKRAVRWSDFILGPMPQSIAIVEELAAAGVPLFGLTNWPAQVWPPTRVITDGRYDFGFLSLFEDIVVSGVEQLRKPDPAIFHRALARFGLEPCPAIFVDDLAHNVEAAKRQGIAAIRFESPVLLRQALAVHGLAKAC